MSDGLTEGLISSLSQLPGMKVMARSTVFRFKGKQDDPQQIGQALKVSALLTGRITQHADHMIVDADLVNAADGSEIWGSHYERRLSDVTQVQSDISRDLTNKLNIHLAGSNQQKLGNAGTSNSEAYRLYLEGRQLWYSRDPEGLKKSITLFRQAIAADPNYALAYTGLANTYVVAPSYGIGIKSKDAMVVADEASRKALELDPSLEEAHTTRAGFLAFTRQWSDAEAEYKKVFAMNPNNATAHYFYASAVLIPLGRIDEALDHYRIALSLDPLSPVMNMNYAFALECAHRYDEAEAQFKKILEREPNFAPPRFYYTQFLAIRGRYAEALRELDHFNGPAMRPISTASFSRDAKGYNEMLLASELDDNSTYNLEIAVSYALRGNSEKVFEYLTKDVSVDPELPAELRSPAFDPLRSDPRFKKVLSELNVPQ